MSKIALFGAGRMGTLHAHNLAAHERLDLAYVVDPKPLAAARLAAETGALAATATEALADPDVRGIVIASSTDAHLADSLAGLNAGKAAFCEKPLSLSTEELQAAASDLTRPGLPPLFVGFNRRFDRDIRALHERLRAGEIGRLESLHIVNHDPAPPDPDFVPRSGGLFRDFSIHDLDLAGWFLQSPIVELFAMASCLVDPGIGALGDVDTAKIVLRSADGALCVISNSRRTGYGYDQRIEAFGSAGALRIGNPSVDGVTRWSDAGPSRSPFPFAFPDRYRDAYRGELDHFADLIEGGTTPATGLGESLAANRLADAAERSVKTGAPVRLDLGGQMHA